MSHSDGTAKGSQALVGNFSLGELAEFCRDFGVMRLVYQHGDQRCELVLGDEPEVPLPAAPVEPKTPEEERVEARRRHFRRILGREPTASELENLP